MTKRYQYPILTCLMIGLLFWSANAFGEPPVDEFEIGFLLEPAVGFAVLDDTWAWDEQALISFPHLSLTPALYLRYSGYVSELGAVAGFGLPIVNAHGFRIGLRLMQAWRPNGGKAPFEFGATVALQGWLVSATGAPREYQRDSYSSRYLSNFMVGPVIRAYVTDSVSLSLRGEVTVHDSGSDAGTLFNSQFGVGVSW